MALEYSRDLYWYIFTNVTYLEPFWTSVVIRSVCRHLYRRRNKVSQDSLSPTHCNSQTGREQTCVFILQMRRSMSSRWHKNGICYSSAHSVANTEWLIGVNQSDLESVVVPGKRSPQLSKNTHPSMLCLHNQGPGCRVTWAGNPPPPHQVNKAGTPFCYCCRRNSCLSHAAATMVINDVSNAAITAAECCLNGRKIRLTRVTVGTWPLK